MVNKVNNNGLGQSPFASVKFQGRSQSNKLHFGSSQSAPMKGNFAKKELKDHFVKQGLISFKGEINPLKPANMRETITNFISNVASKPIVATAISKIASSINTAKTFASYAFEKCVPAKLKAYMLSKKPATELGSILKPKVEALEAKA